MTKFSGVKGFTLVELLVAVTIIAIMASVAMVSYNTIQKNTRDASRKSDVASLVTAIELYKQTNGSTPAAACSGAAAFASALIPSSGATFINKIPVDPSCKGTPGSTTPCACATSGYGFYYNIDQNGRIFILADTEIAVDTTTCASLTMPSGVTYAATGVTVGGKLFKYCYAP